MIHQSKPHMICQNIGAIIHGGVHRDHRCSLECRSNWAELEALIMIWQLERVKHNSHIYCGNIHIKADLTYAEHLTIRKLFLKLIRDTRQQKQIIKFSACSEVGSNGRIHYHYIIYSNCIVNQKELKKIWNVACYPYRNILYHEPIRSIEAACKYMFKDVKAVRERKQWINLLEYNSIRIMWQTRGFFQPNKETVKKHIMASWKNRP